MGKKDKKSKTAEQKARKEAKLSKKTAKGEKKAKTKAKDEDSDAEDVDLDAVLKSYAEEQAKFLKVSEESCPAPSPRSSSTIIASPSNRNELLIFGGESFDGSLAKFYNNLYLYHINRNEWREITSPNTPLPRSGHAWCRGGNAGGIYLFGGEFSSPKQGTFHHYNDFWHLDPSTREWTRLETKGKAPPARSGHRMTYFKNYIILFGGFQDTSQQTKYLQDLWIYDTQSFVWYNPTLPPASQKPDARSSFTFLPHDSGAVIYGGYSRVKVVAKGGKTVAKTTLQPMIHQDTWFLRITQPANPGSVAPTVRWEKRKRPVNAPNPARAGATMAFHKGRAILFGGVHDVEESEEGIDSEFYNELFAWNVDRNRFFPLGLRRPRTGSKKQQAGSQARGRKKGKADEQELLRNLAALEARGNITIDTDEMDVDNLKIADDEDDDDSKKANLPVRFELPHPRFNAQLTVQDDVLFIFGGTVERGDQEFTFNDLFSIDLNKLDGVREIFYNDPDKWNDKMEVESEDEDEEGEGDDDESGEDSDEEMPDASGTSSPTPTSASDLTSLSSPTTSKAPIPEPIEEVEPETPISTKNDGLPYPRPFETLREFHSRTSNDWQNILLEKMKYGGTRQQEEAQANMVVKELRKRGFEMAEERWWDCREEVRAAEDELEEGGIGEVVSLADRGGGASGGAGRRR